MGQSADLNDFVPWTKTAPRGSRFVYHTGHLAEDTVADDGTARGLAARRAADGVRVAAMVACIADDVALVQRPLVRPDGFRVFQYIAVKL